MPGSVRSGSQAVERALDVLSCFEGDRRLALSELSAEVGLPLSTTHRIVQALCRHGYLLRSTDAYRVGARIHSLVPRGELEIDEAVPYLYALAAGVKLVVTFGAPTGTSVVRIVSARPPVDYCESQVPADREPLHATAMGKALLAFSSDGPAGAVRRLGALEPFTDRTSISRAALMTQLAEVRRSGFAFADQERTDGVRELAVPVLGASGAAIAAIGLQARHRRMTRDLAVRIVPALRHTAAEVGRRVRVLDGVG